MQAKTIQKAPVLYSRTDATVSFLSGQEFLSFRNVRAAIESFDSAQSLGYRAADCAAARWNCWMLLGDFERAWRESDFIASVDSQDPHRYWDGRTWNDRRVMLRCLHGLGDTIQFIRYAPLLREGCRSLKVQTHPQLVTLLKSVSGIDHICTWGSQYVENPKDWDMQMEIMELPRAFRTTLATIPSASPYIHVPKERIEWGGAHFRSRKKKLRIGLAWEAGSWDPSRSINFQEMAPLFSCQRCCFYSLQKGASLPNTCDAIVDLEANATDVRDTAALILNLDLVLTVDTMTAHLAGALGRPVWLLLPASADWRWMLARADTPWYPNTRIFRQQICGDWRGVIEEVLSALHSSPGRVCRRSSHGYGIQ